MKTALSVALAGWLAGFTFGGIAAADEDRNTRVRTSAVVEVIDDPKQVEDIISKLKAQRADGQKPPNPRGSPPRGDPDVRPPRPPLPSATPDRTPVDSARGPNARRPDTKPDTKHEQKGEHERDRDLDRDRDRHRERHRR